MGTIIGVIKGDTRSLDTSSYVYVRSSFGEIINEGMVPVASRGGQSARAFMLLALLVMFTLLGPKIILRVLSRE